MPFDQETAETLAPILGMIGQEARLDPEWTCQMLEAVTGQVLPDFYRQQRDASENSAERIRHGIKIVLTGDALVDDLVQLAAACADEERLPSALHWVTLANELQPDDGELLRFKASILERMGSFEGALNVAREAELHGADPEAIKQDVERLHRRYLAHLDAASERVLPDFHRQQRNASAINKERVRYGLKLTSLDDPSPDDLIDLAHAYADEEKLSDALYWIGKAIELHPGDGEVLRFKASILERMGRFEEALQVAHEASQRAADPASIASDIDRVTRRFIADLREGTRSGNSAKSLTSYAKLLQAGNPRLSDLMRFVGLTVASCARTLKSQR